MKPDIDNRVPQPNDTYVAYILTHLDKFHENIKRVHSQADDRSSTRIKLGLAIAGVGALTAFAGGGFNSMLLARIGIVALAGGGGTFFGSIVHNSYKAASLKEAYNYLKGETQHIAENSTMSIQRAIIMAEETINATTLMLPRTSWGYLKKDGEIRIRYIKRFCTPNSSTTPSRTNPPTHQKNKIAGSLLAHLNRLSQANKKPRYVIPSRRNNPDKGQI